MASFLKIFAQAFSEYKHVVVCSRNIGKPQQAYALSASNILSIGQVDHQKAIEIAGSLGTSIAILNHIFFDLDPITKSDVRRQGPPILSFLHSQELPPFSGLDDVDRVIVFSKHFREIYKTLPVTIEPEVIALGVDTSVFCHIIPHVREGTFVIGNITNGAPWKHSENFVSMCLQIAKVIPNARFVFLGGKDLTDQVQDLTAFQMLAPYSVKPVDYLAKINLLIHKTRSDTYETWGLVITEAMAAGIPVVADAKGGIKDQITNGENGFLCKNDQDFVSYCSLLYQDKNLYRSISNQARLRAQSEFSLHSFQLRVEKALML